MIEIDLSVEEAWGEGDDWHGLCFEAVDAAMAVIERDDLSDRQSSVSVSIALTHNARVHTLNRDYRGKDKPTNVLAFPMTDGSNPGAPRPDGIPLMLGDIAVAYETCAAEAESRGIALSEHLTHLVVHATLHLLGCDHIDSDEADAMEALEIKALASLGLPDPYQQGNDSGDGRS